MRAQSHGDSERKKISVIVPAYCEAPNLPYMAKRVKQALDGKDFELIFTIDSNADGSFQVARQLEEEYTEVRALLSKKRRGKTKSIIDGFKASRGDSIVIIDADLQYPPEAIPRLAEKLDKYDVVNGRRIGRKDNLIRKLESETYNLMTSTLFKGHFEDNDSGLKAFRREVFRDIVPYLRERWHRYFLVLTAERGYDINEVSIPHYPRERGTSKFGASPLKLFKGFVDLVSVKCLTSSVYFKGTLGLERLLEKFKLMNGRLEDLVPVNQREELYVISPLQNFSPELRIL